MIWEKDEATYIYSVGNIKDNISMETVIGKYFDLNGFLKTMESSKLRITKISKFEDKAEGLPLYTDFIESLKRSEKNVSEEYKQQRIESKIKIINNYYASCWIMKEVESYLMWKNYSNYAEGLLIFTTIGKLLDSLKLRCYENKENLVNFFYGEVDYEHKLSMKNDHISAFGKTKYFEDEQEFRIVRYNHPLKEDDYLFIDIQDFNFIDRIVCSPDASDEFVDLIKKFILGLGFNESIIRTSEIRNNNRRILDNFL